MKTTLIKFLQTEMNWNPINISFIEKLGGLSSENYKVSYNNNDYFVKICIADYLHTDRVNELSILRSIPMLSVIKPADVNELVGCYDFIINKKLPTALVLPSVKKGLIPNTNASSKELLASLLLPWTPVQLTSPTA